MRGLRVLPPLSSMRCDAACGECCGVVPVTEADFHRVERYVLAHSVPILDQGLTCPFFQGGTCAVYTSRPMVCRLFGHVERMTCPRGYNTNIDEDAANMWCNSAHRDRRLVFENVDAGGERHMIPVPKARVLELWGKLIAGDFAALEAEPWKPGYVEGG